jgi:hypothetical protein
MAVLKGKSLYRQIYHQEIGCSVQASLLKSIRFKTLEKNFSTRFAAFNERVLLTHVVRRQNDLRLWCEHPVEQ